MSIDMAQFHQVFFEESFEGLDIMESGLLRMDPSAVDPEDINAIFRAAHSIKGGSGTFGFTNIADFTHVMETLLDEMRDGRRAVTSGGVDVLLRSVDVLKAMLEAARDGGDVDAQRVAAQKQELDQELKSNPSEPQSAAQTSGPAGPAAETAEQAEPQPIGWHIVFRPLEQMMRTGNDPLRILRELGGLGDLRLDCDSSELPSFEDFDPEACYLSWDLHLEGEGIDQEAVSEVFDWVEDDCELIIIPKMPLHSPRPAAVTAQAEAEPTTAALQSAQTAAPVASTTKGKDAPSKAAANSGGGSIRVDIHKIDALINMVGELVITQSMLGLLGADFDMARLDRLQEGLVQLERHTRELQESVMQIRMLPISFTFSRFPRLVHDLSAKLGKQIELKMSGENTEVDKTVIEKIGDPLVHLVRNSIDHGLEGPEERRAAGKPETGTVQLNAFHKGGNIIIEIRDDGRGLNRDRIEQKAIERGLIEAEHSLSDKQIYELIFQPGFSTADAVSDLSGRGVGMDVVRRNINELGGSIEIESTPGQGSAIIIRLPLTLAILDGQSIAVGDETYIIPLVSIVESIQMRKHMINLVAGRGETFKLRDEYLPIIRLHQLFGISSARSRDLGGGLLVVVEGEGRRCGLFVDDLLGQQQVVIKSLEANYKRVEGISGATILGDGSVALILDIPGLIRLANRSQRPAPVEPPMSLVG
ncbi:chemotaxis protein CheA [Magnetovirga frankeli]|uniref:chemotaxis protein CheA n=1 Tax=Magnetovirga frankeli TaxID=947516 RepID=UPI0012932E66|nr:chemotaxis protein CheA [gamma proteobacterium SS-5]